ncbi:MAG: cyclic nucleotide-binding domain-containing protein [Acidobacteria bacterium]|nr:cyclic nucleotide-binding domain-containing protein [Acidobacteriota bacterium]
MPSSILGRRYRDGDTIVRQGEKGEHMYVIQMGQVEVVEEVGDKEVRLSVLGDGDIFGEMALFDHQARSATVRALGEVRVLTVDKRTLMRRLQEDPSFALRLIQRMASRIRELNTEVARLKAASM